MLIHNHKIRLQATRSNKIKLLTHLRDAGYSSATVISRLLGKSKSCVYKLLSRLEGQGYVRKHFVAEAGLSVWGLTDDGILMSWQEHEDIKPRIAFQPSKLSPIMIQHELELQLVKIQSEEAGYKDFVFGNHLPGKLDKRPDALVISNTGRRISCELERFSKSRKRLRQIISIYLQAIKRGEYDEVAYIAPNRDVASRLRRLFRSIETVPVAGQDIPLLERHYEHFKFYSLQGWPEMEVIYESA